MAPTKQGLTLVGIDESGYGAIAGPVTVCAVIVRPEWRQELEELGIRDSKNTSHERRVEIVEWIKERRACEWALVDEPAFIIEQVGPWDTVCKAARTALLTLTNHLGFPGELERFDILMDGKNPLKGIPRGISNRCRVGADEKILEVTIASLLAKVHRDWEMERLAGQYPIYEWERNKGYSVDQHCEALFHYGPMPHHRLHHGAWKATKNHWEKYYKPKGIPMPHWLAELNPRYAKSQQRENQRDETQYPA